ncbi:MAG TPA: hypothetical protein DEP51_03950 [Clostridiales bacterium]|nr:hypothetical protein [Clostridiales bacterium]
MENEYIRESKILDKTEDEKKSELMQNIIYTKRLLMQSHVNFEYAENGLIDYYTYNIKANQAKLDYLIKQAKDLGLIIDEVRVNFIIIY